MEEHQEIIISDIKQEISLWKEELKIEFSGRHEFKEGYNVYRGILRCVKVLRDLRMILSFYENKIS